MQDLRVQGVPLRRRVRPPRDSGEEEDPAVHGGGQRVRQERQERGAHQLRHVPRQAPGPGGESDRGENRGMDVSSSRERREHAGAALRAGAEVRAALRLLPRQGQPGPGRPPLRHRAHVPVHRPRGRRDRVPQRQGLGVPAQGRHFLRVCTQRIGSETGERRRRALLQPARRRRAGPAQPPRELPSDPGREVVGAQVDPRQVVRGRPPGSTGAPRGNRRRVRRQERALRGVGRGGGVRQEPGVHARRRR